MKRDPRSLADAFLQKNKGAEMALKEYLDEEGSLLGHCFFPRVINYPLEKLLQKNCDSGRIKKYVAFIAQMYDNGDDDVRNIVEVSIIEYFALGEPVILQRLLPYLPPPLAKLAKQIEQHWGTGDCTLADD